MKNLWGIREYGLSGLWVKRASTVLRLLTFYLQLEETSSVCERIDDVPTFLRSDQWYCSNVAIRTRSTKVHLVDPLRRWTEPTLLKGTAGNVKMPFSFDVAPRSVFHSLIRAIALR